MYLYVFVCTLNSKKDYIIRPFSSVDLSAILVNSRIMGLIPLGSISIFHCMYMVEGEGEDRRGGSGV